MKYRRGYNSEKQQVVFQFSSELRRFIYLVKMKNKRR